MTIPTTASTITDHEAAQVERANATKATPVVFVHGPLTIDAGWREVAQKALEFVKRVT